LNQCLGNRCPSEVIKSHNFDSIRKEDTGKVPAPSTVSPPIHKRTVSRDTFFGRPLVKWFSYMLSDRCLSVCPACNVGALWPNGWTDQDESWRVGRPRSWPRCVRWAPSSPPQRGAKPPNFRPISVVAKWLDGSRSHLVWRKDLAQATLC